jgi:hypothetical protein
MLHMGTACQFGHYATILLMHSLCSYNVRSYLTIDANGCGGFVARRLDGENGDIFLMGRQGNVFRKAKRKSRRVIIKLASTLPNPILYPMQGP